MITVVLDDDPTGTQAMRDVPVILDWSDPAVWNAIRRDDRAVHVLTNSRAFDGAQAARLVRSAAEAALDALSARGGTTHRRFLLRGDSTLRAHVWEEYEALREVLFGGERAVPLLLVPALPAAGRVTVGGVHLLERDGVRTPLHATEYAGHGAFAYASADLSQWAQERSGGRLVATDAQHIALAELRSPDGAQLVADVIVRAQGLGRAAAVVPDAETVDDLRTIAEGVLAAEATGTPFLIRCAPAFVLAITDPRATLEPAEAPAAGGGILIVCGSFVPTTTAQVERFAKRHPDAIVEAHVADVASDDAEAEISRVCALLRSGSPRRGRDGPHQGSPARRRVSASRGEWPRRHRRARSCGRRDRQGRNHLGRHRAGGSVRTPRVCSARSCPGWPSGASRMGRATSSYPATSAGLSSSLT